MKTFKSFRYSIFQKDGIFINKLFFAFAFMTLGTVQTYSQTYNLVWEDNFDGTQLKQYIWNIEVNGDGGGNNELQYYRSENVSVGIEPVSGANCLIITAKKENYSNKTCTSGRINTQGKMEFKYGKIECRIKLPKTANGLWPAFWMMGWDYPTVGWPKCGEIDILEMGSAKGITNGTQERYFNGAFHYGEQYPQTSDAQAFTSSYSLQDDFHLYTMTWDGTTAKMYLDQDIYPNVAPYCQKSITNTSVGQPGYYFNKPFYVLLNLAIGGSFPNITNINNVTALNAANNYEAKMYVDYIKVYQKGDNGESFYAAECAPLLKKTINTSICEGGVYNFYGTNYTEAVSGIEYRFSNPGRCDSVITLNLTVNPLLQKTINTSICEGGVYNFYGTNYTEAVSGIEHRFSNPGRCDSIVTLNLTVNPLLRKTINTSICEGGVYNFYGTNYTEAVSGIEHRFSNAGSCDSIVTLNLTVTYPNTSVTLQDNTLTANQADAQYQWYKGCINLNSQMTPIYNATEQTFTPTENGYYSVEITYQNCVYFSDCEEVKTLKVDNIFADNISIYPNPVKDKLRIKSEELRINSVEILDITGKEILNAHLLDNQYLIDTNSLPQGIYLIKIYTDKGTVIKRFIKM